MPKPTEERVGPRIGARRRALGLTQAELARRLGAHVVTVARYEAGRIQLGERKLRELAEALETTPAALLGEPASSLEPLETFAHTPRRAPRLAPRAYALVHGYLEQLERAGCTAEQIDEAERLMLDFSFSKLHKREPRERTEDDQVKDVNALWLVIVATLRDEGVSL